MCSGVSKNSSDEKITGSEANDKLCNVYDLLGCCYEWTLESNYGNSRVGRGGTYLDNNSPSYRHDYGPNGTYSDGSTRLSFYIK